VKTREDFGNLLKKREIDALRVSVIISNVKFKIDIDELDKLAKKVTDLISRYRREMLNTFRNGERSGQPSLRQVSENALREKPHFHESAGPAAGRRPL